jgi:hypothetical protein
MCRTFYVSHFLRSPLGKTTSGERKKCDTSDTFYFSVPLPPSLLYILIFFPNLFLLEDSHERFIFMRRAITVCFNRVSYIGIYRTESLWIAVSGLGKMILNFLFSSKFEQKKII